METGRLAWVFRGIARDCWLALGLAVEVEKERQKMIDQKGVE